MDVQNALDAGICCLGVPCCDQETLGPEQPRALDPYGPNGSRPLDLVNGSTWIWDITSPHIRIPKRDPKEAQMGPKWVPNKNGSSNGTQMVSKSYSQPGPSLVQVGLVPRPGPLASGQVPCWDRKKSIPTSPRWKWAQNIGFGKLGVINWQRSLPSGLKMKKSY